MRQLEGVPMSESIEGFFEELRRRGLGEDSFEDTLRKAQDTKLYDIIEECNSLLPIVHPSDDNSFRYVANASLSGEPTPCASWECRSRNLDAAARFAALFSDTVYIRNPFEKHIRHARQETSDDVDHSIALDDLRAVWMVRPLLEEGIFAFANGDIHLCEEHYQEAGIDEWMKKARQVAELLEAEYADRSQIIVSRFEQNDYRVNVTGPEDIIEHGSLSSIWQTVPKDIEKALQGSDQYILSKEQAKQFGWYSRKTEAQLADLFVQNWYSRAYGCSYVTDRSRDIYVAELINTANHAPSAKALIEGIAHSVPIVMNVPLEKVVALRRSEEDAFNVYRDALLSVLKEVDLQDSNQIRTAVADAVLPGINQIRHRITKARRILKEGLREDLVLGAGFITVGLFSGLLGDLGQALAALGGAKYAMSILGKVNALFREPEVARDDKWYFLWKLENEGK